VSTREGAGDSQDYPHFSQTAYKFEDFLIGQSIFIDIIFSLAHNMNERSFGIL